ncbi:hypothetical protein CALVIDRAFT_525875 [Calocera viscosa TUFC12733]|uniref:Uncharacterized protein n=1 Tax=Calocera viscosa (strain TUFC12733) TaxID=1330018 RepID=A0A167PLD9_CALVF|nr:hypothetical protein CALVIDRAFT_525875 [Calocera viscosa TUFC12733]
MPTPVSSKKRKHADVDPGQSEASTSTASAQKHKEKKHRKAKAKAAASHAVLGNEAGPLDQPFTRLRATMTVSIPPMFVNNPRRGVEEMLDSLVMKYSPTLEGVLLAHSQLSFLSPTALLIADSPFSTARISYTALVWQPRIGMRLRGSVSLCGPDHVGLILEKTWNCSVPKWGIDELVWEYVPGAREEEGGEGEEGVDSGWWKTKMSGDPLGRERKTVDFTVVGMTIANQMLSLTGSLLSDPLNPANLPSEDSLPLKNAQQPPRATSPGSDASSDLDPTEPMFGSMLVDWDRPRDVDDEEAEEEDGFAGLTRRREEAAEQQQRLLLEAPAQPQAEVQPNGEDKENQKKDKAEKKKRKAEKAAAAAEGGEGEPKKKKRKKEKVKFVEGA